MNIKRRKFLKTVAAVPGVSLLGMPAIALGAKPTTWRLQSLWGAGEVPFQLLQTFCEQIKERTQGQLVITPYASGTVVGAFETLDAVSQGILHAQSTAPVYWSGREAALGVIGDFAFGYSHPKQQETWLYEHGGLDLLREAYRKQHRVHTVGCAWWGVESLTSKIPVRRPEDFKGLKHRGSQGLAGETIAKMGASIVVIPGGEAYSALERGVVDTVDWSTISGNARVGFFEIAKYATHPGFHSMPLQDLTINQRAWDALPDDIKSVINTSWREFATRQLEVMEAEDAKALEEVKRRGVELVEWSAEDLQRARGFAQEVYAEWAQKSPLAKRAVESQVAFLRQINVMA